MFRDATLCLKLPAEHRLGIRALLTVALARLHGWYVAYRQRRALLRLDDTMLKDIGISRVDALQEGSKPFWRP